MAKTKLTKNITQEISIEKGERGYISVLTKKYNFEDLGYVTEAVTRQEILDKEWLQEDIKKQEKQLDTYEKSLKGIKQQLDKFDTEHKQKLNAREFVKFEKEFEAKYKDLFALYNKKKENDANTERFEQFQMEKEQLILFLDNSKDILKRFLEDESN
jgi:hypothetical protein